MPHVFFYEIRQMSRLQVSEVEIVMLGLYGKVDTEDEARKGQVLRKLAGRTGMKQNMVSLSRIYASGHPRTLEHYDKPYPSMLVTGSEGDWSDLLGTLYYRFAEARTGKE